jgi:hypothetical protein
MAATNQAASQNGQEIETVFCPDCGTVLDTPTMLIAALSERVQALEHELGNKVAQNSRLKGERLKKYREKPQYKIACRVLQNWKDVCMPTAREIESGDRLVNVMARLAGGFTEDELKRSVYGYSLKPYVVPPGVRATVGLADQWRADAELIFRDPQRVQQGIAIADAHDAMQQTLEAAAETDLAPSSSGASPQTSMSVADAIASYASRMNFAVFPCLTDQKIPATAHGFQDATKDTDRIRKCWAQRPDLNVAIATGRASGVVVIDVDVHKGGDESLVELEKRYGKLPTTLSAVTPRGGQHHYFRYPGETIPNAVDIVPGVDVRGDGGYVLLPPSKVNGNAYEWDERTEPVPLPTWLMVGLRQRERKARDVSYWINLAKGVNEGQRNVRLTELTGLMVGRGLPDDLVATLAIAVNRQFHPPLPEREVGMIVKSILRRHQPYPPRRATS